MCNRLYGMTSHQAPATRRDAAGRDPAIFLVPIRRGGNAALMTLRPDIRRLCGLEAGMPVMLTVLPNDAILLHRHDDEPTPLTAGQQAEIDRIDAGGDA